MTCVTTLLRRIMQPIGRVLSMMDRRNRAELAGLDRFSSRILVSIFATSVLRLGLIAAMVAGA